MIASFGGVGAILEALDDFGSVRDDFGGLEDGFGGVGDVWKGVGNDFG